MTKVKPKTKEQVIYFLISNISLGTYDKRFLSNLESMNVVAKKPLTTNQATLFEKIILRYARQLQKLEISSESLINLPWTLEPIPSLPQFTEAHLILDNSTLVLSSPYKKDFINDLRKSDVNGKWNREERLWTIPASPFSLKLLKKDLEKHYGKVNYCDEIKKLLSDVEVYKNYKYWDPTFTYINGNFYLIATSENLISQTSNIPFETELHTIAHLIRYGITIDDSVIEKFKEKFTEEEIQFALSAENSIEYNDTSIVEKLVKLKTDCVFIKSFTTFSKDYTSSIRESLRTHNIKYKEFSFSEDLNPSLRKCKYPVIIFVGGSMRGSSLPSTVAKIINCVNSNPVNIK